MAGHTRFAAIILAAGFLAGACSDSGAGDPSPTTTPPPPTATQPAPTPTLPPPLEQTSGIDTTGWQQYESPLGITIKYPADWTLATFDESGQLNPEGTYAVISNGVPDETREDAGTPGVMRATIRLYPGDFDPDHFLGICPGLPALVSIDRRGTVICEIEAVTPAGLDSFNFWIEMDMPSGDVVSATSSAIGPTGNDVAIARAIIESVTLTPPIDTSAWPLYEDDTFSMRYPPTWHVEVEDHIPGYVYFRNEEAHVAQARREEEGPPSFLSEGEASIAVGASLFMRFGLEILIDNCQEATVDTTFAGLPATMCGDQYWVELPSGGLINVRRLAYETDARTHRLLDAALATITFHE